METNGGRQLWKLNEIREAKLKSGMRRIVAEDVQNVPQNDKS